MAWRTSTSRVPCLAALGVAEVEHRVAVHVLDVHRRALPQEELHYSLAPLKEEKVAKTRVREDDLPRGGGEVLLKNKGSSGEFPELVLHEEERASDITGSQSDGHE